MGITFMESPRFFFTSESVSEGHPDKLCDQVSDAILDAILEQDPRSRVACETATTTGLVIVMGEITTNARVNYQEVIRNTVRDIGYTSSGMGFDADTCGVMVTLDRQSPDIAQGVDQALETRGGEVTDEEVDSIGAGDQGMMIGFACNETPDMMPLTIDLSHKLVLKLAEERKEGQMSYLRPDSKSQVTVQYAHGKPVHIDTVVISTQHHPDVEQEQIQHDVITRVIRKIAPEDLIDGDTKIYINPTGRFVTGGPMGDAGLTGRKIIVDTYGGVARHGGGAFSGKDPTKVDRSAAYAARYVAKNVVAAGLADRFEVQLSYAIGVAQPISISIESFGTGKVSDEVIAKAINEIFDLRPGAFIRDMNLRRPIYRQTAAYGHFGRSDVDLPWEHTDKVDALKSAAGL